MPKISVIVVTNRKGFEGVLNDDMARQTFRDFELIVADDNYFLHPDLFPKAIHFRPRQKLEGESWNLNKAYNDSMQTAQGELLVFLQDFIWIPDDGLQRFWDDYQKYPNAMITGCGHKAQVGLEGISEYDHRVDGDSGVHPCTFAEWEMNWATCPRWHMPRFNEKMDEFYGGENQYVAKKAQLNGIDIKIDRDNQCIQYSQAYCGGRPADWESRHANKDGRQAAFLKYLDLTAGQEYNASNM